MAVTLAFAKVRRVRASPQSAPQARGARALWLQPTNTSSIASLETATASPPGRGVQRVALGGN
jgi:hypothetical protein